MKILAPLLFVGGLFLAYLYFTGQIGGYGEGVPNVQTPDAGTAVHAAGNAGQHGLDWFLATAWAPAALVALVITGVLIKFWQKIGGFGRAVLLVVGAICVTVFVTGMHR
jgi:hypothetical protein